MARKPTYLLDANVLIALMTAEHVHHARASAWAAELSRFATCPIVEGAVVRFAVRLGARAVDAQGSLRLMSSRPGHEFWPDSVAYADLDLDGVRGHAQVTDAYLVGLAASNGGILATLDAALAEQWPERTLLVPG